MRVFPTCGSKRMDGTQANNEDGVHSSKQILSRTRTSRGMLSLSSYFALFVAHIFKSFGSVQSFSESFRENQTDLVRH